VYHQGFGDRAVRRRRWLRTKLSLRPRTRDLCGSIAAASTERAGAPVREPEHVRTYGTPSPMLRPAAVGAMDPMVEAGCIRR